MSFYTEIVERFYGVQRDDVIDAIEFSCITEAQWQNDPEDCLARVQGALEEISNFDFGDMDDGVSEYQEWYDYDEDC